MIFTLQAKQVRRRIHVIEGLRRPFGDLMVLILNREHSRLSNPDSRSAEQPWRRLKNCAVDAPSQMHDLSP
jgi:hypothetical protein